MTGTAATVQLCKTKGQYLLTYKMYGTGLMVLTSPLIQLLPRLNSVIHKASLLVRDRLYVHLAPGLPGRFPGNPAPPTVAVCPQVKNLISSFYGISASKGVDVRFLLSNIGSVEIPSKRQRLKYPYDVVLTESLVKINTCDVMGYVSEYLPCEQDLAGVKCLVLENDEVSVSSAKEEEGLPSQLYNHVVLGGTFDRLHAGHKILLNEACMLAKKSLTNGVTKEVMHKNKTLCELIGPCELRIDEVLDFLTDIKPSLEYKIVPISDPFGPSIVDPRLQCIIVSEETKRGGEAVNKRRQENGLLILDIMTIDLVKDTGRSPEEEEKISSSSQRKRSLGTLRKPPAQFVEGQPYVIGLTGGTASGKSSICKRLEKLGAAIVDCDKLGHEAYKKGTPTFQKVVKHFGQDVVNSEGEIDRKALGSKVFSNSKDGQLEKLNGIVWPGISELAKQQIEQYHMDGKQVIVLDAAVLLEAGWDSFVQEVWVVVVPRKEAVHRLMERNSLPLDVAEKRVAAQITNEARVEKAHVVLSTLWAYKVTQAQVEKAWGLLSERLFYHQIDQ